MTSPPNRRSGFPTGRGYREPAPKTAFEQAQRDLQAMVRRIGLDNLPLNDETLRPALKLMWDFAEQRGERLWVFDMTDKGVSRGQLYCSLTGELLKIGALSNELGRLLDETFKQHEITRIKPVFAILPGGKGTLYFEGVWTPLAALQSRRH